MAARPAAGREWDTGAVKVHLVDGTYELFRYFFALPPHVNDRAEEVSAARGVLGSMLTLLEDGVTHVAVATDHIIESFRNDLWSGYKDGSGIDPVLFGQFPIVEEALAAAGFTVWPMVEFEADDALGAGAAMAAADPRVDQVVICTPDKDLGQCVTDDGRIVQLDRRKGVTYDRAGVIEKFGVPPESIPDYLALVGDSADGFPGLQGWGAKSAAAVLAHYGHLEDIPTAAGQWDITVRGGTVSALSSAGKGVEAHGNVQLSGGELALDSAKDGIGADGNVEISGGSLKVVSAKDGIQAGADNSSTGDIDILGGAVSVCAQKLAMKSGGRAQISGGELFAVAGTDKADVFSGSSAQAWLVCSYSGAAGSTAAISAGGTTLAEISARFAYSSVLFASSRLAAGTEYTISGGAAETTATLSDRAA